jgi:hypothetical protein
MVNASHGATNAVPRVLATHAKHVLANPPNLLANLASNFTLIRHSKQKHVSMQRAKIDVKHVGLEHLNQLSPLPNEIKFMF